MILAINIVYTAQPDNVLQEVKLLKLCPPVPLLSRPWDSLGEILLGMRYTESSFTLYIRGCLPLLYLGVFPDLFRHFHLLL